MKLYSIDGGVGREEFISAVIPVKNFLKNPPMYNVFEVFSKLRNTGVPTKDAMGGKQIFLIYIRMKLKNDTKHFHDILAVLLCSRPPILYSLMLHLCH